ncbi:MAG TPA: DUF6166 domain-containing protein [Miltoncostaeaceae bacterium]|nr:DUF6166 domain-containing protein [Miltoncostaeaceae bacterium]
MNPREPRPRATTTGGPAATPRRRGAQERFYVGRRADRPEVYIVSLCDVEPLRPPTERLDAAFAWGADAQHAGAELAFAILSHATGREPPEPVCEEFCAEVVASLPDAGFVIGCDDVALWLAAERRAPETWRRAPGRGVRRRLADALAALVASLNREPSGVGPWF